MRPAATRSDLIMVKLSFDCKNPSGSSGELCLAPPELKMNQVGQGRAFVRPEQRSVRDPTRRERARFDEKIRTFKRWP